MGLAHDIMRMDLDPPPVEQPKKFRYVSKVLWYPNQYDTFRKSRFVWIQDESLAPRRYDASVNDVVSWNDGTKDNLYVWNGKERIEFHPGPCTDYDGPRPYYNKSAEEIRKSIQDKVDSLLYTGCHLGKKIYPSSRPIHDTANPLAKMAEEAMRGYEKPIDPAWGVPDTIERNGNMVLAKYNLRYIGETDTNIRDTPKSWLVQIIHHTGTTIGRRTISPQIGFVVSYNDVEYVYTGPENGWVAINNYRKEETTMPVRYDRIYPRLTIKKVIFNAPATIVVWDDGTKTVVKCENEEYDPEKGLAMAIAKKALGNQGNYYNQFKKWLPEKEEGPTVIIPDIGSPLHEAAKRLAEGVNNALSGLKKDSE